VSAWLKALFTLILYKTAKAVSELQSEKRLLNMQQRRILLFVNSARSLDEIKALVNLPNANEIIYLLEKDGYLTKIPPDEQISFPSEPNLGKVISAVSHYIGQVSTIKNSRSPATSQGEERAKTSPAKAEQIPISNRPVFARPENKPVNENLNEDAMLQIKSHLLETSEQHLGLFSRDLVDQIKRASSTEMLRVCISRWHMAMQESKTGRVHCMQYLQYVNSLFETAEDGLAEPS
jgi:hypothetical protein